MKRRKTPSTVAGIVRQIVSALVFAPLLSQAQEGKAPLLWDFEPIPSPASFNAGPPQLRWQSDIDDGLSCPTLGADGTAYVATGHGGVVARRADGSLKWMYDSGMTSPVELTNGPDGTLLVSSNWFVRALQSDGSPIWTHESRSTITASPVAGPDRVVIGTENGLTALRNDGSVAWRYAAMSPVLTTAIGAEGTTYAVLADGAVHALRADGTPAWTTQLDGTITGAPAAAADGVVYISTGSRLLAISEGAVAWDQRPEAAQFSAPAIGPDGTVFVGCYGRSWNMVSQQNHLFAFDSRGNMKWSYQIGGRDGSPPAVAADGTIYVGSDRLYALTPDGELAWEYMPEGAIGSAPVVAADGGLLLTTWSPSGFRDFGGQIHALHFAGATTPPAATPRAFDLAQNRPNPFNPETAIRYRIPEAGQVALDINNALGQRVRSLVDQVQQAGSYEVSWDGRDDAGRALASGVYLYRLQAGSHVETRKLSLTR